MTIDQFTKVNKPITVIVNVSNPLAIRMARILADQGSRLLIVDRLTSAKRKLLGDLLERDDCLFMDAESTFRNIDKFKKIDYVYYFINHLVAGSTFPQHQAESMEILALQHKDFLRETNRIDAYLKLAAEFDASATLVTSGYVAQYLEHLPEANLQLQKYAESLLLDYVEKNRLNGRIVRVGELVGTDYDVTAPTNLARLIREVLLRKKINIFGGGLQQNYIVDTEDAVYAILKAAFAIEAKGRTYLAAYPHPLTSLSLAYQLLELTVDEKEVVFNEILPRQDDIAKLKDMCISPSATALGWEPQIDLDQALSETMKGIAKELNQPWQQLNKTPVIPVQTVVGMKEEAPVPGEKPVSEKPQKGKVKEAFTSQVMKIDQAIATGYKKLIAEPILGLLSFPQKMATTVKKTGPAAKERILSVVLALVVAVFVWVVSLPYIHFVVSGVKLYQLAQSAKTELSGLEGAKLKKLSESAASLTGGMLADVESVSYLTVIPSFVAPYNELVTLLNAIDLYAQSSTTAVDAAIPMLEIVKGIAAARPNVTSGGQTREYFTEITEIMRQKNAVVQASQEAQIAQQRLEKVNFSVFPAFMQGKLYEAKSLLSGYSGAVKELGKYYDLMPYFLGYKDRTNYLLMVQNETELRSTGGWFTNYVLVGVENGAVRELTVNDVYELDGRIQGVTSPADMQKALNIKDFKLSLTNWNPELAVTATEAGNALDRAGKFQANDVTVTMTFQVVQDILRVIGPINIEGLGSVSAENMYEKVGILHEQFTPGTDNKIKTVSQFLPILLDQIASADVGKKQEIMSVLLSAIVEKNVMIYSTNATVRTRLLDTFETYRELKQTSNPLFVVDWNWGGNKANMYLRRTTDIEINEQTKKAKVTMVYTNDSKKDAYPEGKYVNVQRVYFPEQFTFSKAVGYSKPVTLYKTTQEVLYVLTQMEVNIQETKNVWLEYDFKSLPKFMTLMKQSGIDTEVVRVIITPATDKSEINTEVLKNQEFTLADEKWTKTFIRKTDVEVMFKN